MIALRSLTAADIGSISPWFDDDETRHWLGDSSWPIKGLKLAGPNRHELLGLVDGNPVGLVDIEVGPDARAAFAIVISPSMRGQGIGVQMIEACLAAARFAEISEWYAAVERGKVASLQLLQRFGFARVTNEGPDGFSYFARRRFGWPVLPWRPYEPMRERAARGGRGKMPTAAG
ncbi:MAG: GNAT family N-acetyltransferase [Devosia sp.]